MNLLSTGADALWAAALIIVLPALIIGAGEAQGRLRRRGSLLEQPVATFRNRVLPLMALWMLVVLVFNVDPSNFVARLIASGAVIEATVMALQVLRYFATEVRERSKIPGTRSVPQLFMLVPRLIVLLVAAWLLFSFVWNVDLTGLFAALGVTSLVISLALQDTLSGLASGFLLLGDRPFQSGDWIEADDVEGKVVDTNWRSTRIQDRNGDLVVVPNSTLSAATLVNFDQPARLHRVVVELQVAYSNAPSDAVDMLLAAARATEGVLEDPPPEARVVQIDDPLMGYKVFMWIDDYTIAPRVKGDFGALVWYQSHRMGVPLPSPAFDLYHHDPIQEEADATLTEDELAQRIAMAPVFSGIGEADLHELAAAAVPVRFRRGETVLAPGIVGGEIHVLWDGHARIEVVGVPNAFIELSSGDVFGVASRSRDKERSQTVVAVTDCVIVRIDASVGGAVASRNPTLADELNQLLASRSRRLDPLVDRLDIAAPELDDHGAAVTEAPITTQADAIAAGLDTELPS